MLTVKENDHGYVYHGAFTTVLTTDIPSSEHCPVLSKCILVADLCSHFYMHVFTINSSGTASNSLWTRPVVRHCSVRLVSRTSPQT